MPHPAASKSLTDYIRLSVEVQRAKDALSRGIG